MKVIPTPLLQAIPAPPPRDYGYFASLIPSAITLLGNFLGGWWTFGNLLFSFGLLGILDWIVPEDKKNDKDRSGTVPDVVLLAHVVANTLVIFSLLVGIAMGWITGWYILTAMLSTGLHSGMSGILVAHELVHRKERFMRALGIWNLILFNYGHWYVEHVRGHHKNVGKAHDGATARWGETSYAFVLRTIPQQFLSAWRLEARRLQRKGLPVWSVQNFVLMISLLQVVVVTTMFFLLGWLLTLAYLVQGLFAIIILEFVNYLEHYGLSRGDHEAYTVEHSWQTDRISSRFMLLELTRHADHHLRASRPYQNLQSYETSPVLPCGYNGLLLLLLVPPWWFRVMHPIIEEHREESLARKAQLALAAQPPEDVASASMDDPARSPTAQAG